MADRQKDPEINTETFPAFLVSVMFDYLQRPTSLTIRTCFAINTDSECIKAYSSC